MAGTQRTHTFRFEVSRRDGTNTVVATTTIDGRQQGDTLTIAATPTGALNTAGINRAISGASKNARQYATNHNVDLHVSVVNLGSAKDYLVDPSGGVTPLPSTTASPRTTPAAVPSDTIAATSAPVSRAPSGAAPRHKPRGENQNPARQRPPAAVAAPAPRPTHSPRSHERIPTTSRNPTQTRRPAPARPSWAASETTIDIPEPLADKDSGAQTQSEASKPQLVAVTNNKLRIKRKPDEHGGTLKSLLTRFRALSTLKQVLIIGGVLIVAFIGVRACGSGSGEYSAICVDQRTGMRQLDSAPCQDGKVVFYVWYYIKSGDKIPDPNTDYSTTPGTFDKPTSGTITYS